MTKISREQKQSIDDRYNRYVKNSNIIVKTPNTASINQIMRGKGEPLSPIAEKKCEEEGRVSYDQLRSFLWG
jgi:hypothetical protein